MKGFRTKLALIVFGIFIAWPICHIVLINKLKISSWRFFGWGMYATPNPDVQSRLRLVIREHGQNNPADPAQLNAFITQLSEPEQESSCINLFVEDFEQHLRRLPKNHMCQDKNWSRELDYFMHFGSTKHLSKFIKEALFRAQKPNAEAIAFLTNQRFNVFQNKAYLESDIYKINGEHVQYLGKIIN